MTLRRRYRCAVKVLLHRIAPGGSIRVTVDGGAATYLTEKEVRERLAETGGIDATRIDSVIADLSAGRGEHALSFENPGPEIEDYFRKRWTGAPKPEES